MRLCRYISQLDHRRRQREATQKWQVWRCAVSVLVLVSSIRHDAHIIKSGVRSAQAHEDGIHHGLSFNNVFSRLISSQMPRYNPNKGGLPADVVSYEMVLIPIYTGPLKGGHWAMAILIPATGRLMFDSR